MVYTFSHENTREGRTHGQRDGAQGRSGAGQAAVTGTQAGNRTARHQYSVEKAQEIGRLTRSGRYDMMGRMKQPSAIQAALGVTSESLASARAAQLRERAEVARMTIDADPVVTGMRLGNWMVHAIHGPKPLKVKLPADTEEL